MSHFSWTSFAALNFIVAVGQLSAGQPADRSNQALVSDIRTDGSSPTLEVTVADKAYTFVVDTAAPSTVLDEIFRPTLKRTEPRNAVDQMSADVTDTEFYESPPMSVMGTIHGEIPFSNETPVTVLSLGGFRLGPFAHYGLVAERQTTSLLGLAYWRRYVCTFDFPKSKLYLQTGPEFGLQDDGDHCGIGLASAQEGQPYRIAFLAKHSLAEKCGLQPGDRILSLNGRPGAEVSDSEMQLSLSVRLKELPLVIRRGDDTLNLVIPPASVADPLPEVFEK